MGPLSLRFSSSSKRETAGILFSLFIENINLRMFVRISYTNCSKYVCAPSDTIGQCFRTQTPVTFA